MKESIRRIQQEGHSESLLKLVKRIDNMSLGVEYMKTYKEYAFFTLHARNGLCWYHEGIVEKSSSLLLELCLNGTIEVDVKTRRVVRVDGKKVKGITHKQVLDLSDDGERWEGDVLNDQPYGWGVLYDSEGEKAYEGFRVGEVNVCYGRSYYSDIQKVEYEGEWCEGKRLGRGIQYDRNGNIVFEGEWVNDEHAEQRVVLSGDDQFLHNRIEELIVKDNSCNGREWISFDFSILVNLRVLEVGDECFENVKEMKMIGLNRLERVVIGKRCFTQIKSEWPGYDPTRHFYLKNCKRLKELNIGCGSFNDYSMCAIENVPSLEVIEMGRLNESSINFLHASLELKGDSQGLK